MHKSKIQIKSCILFLFSALATQLVDFSKQPNWAGWKLATKCGHMWMLDSSINRLCQIIVQNFWILKSIY